MGEARARAWLRALRRSRTTGDRPNSLMPQRAHAAKDIAQEVAHAVARWRDVGVGLGASKKECDRMATAFEHDDLAAAST